MRLVPENEIKKMEEKAGKKAKFEFTPIKEPQIVTISRPFLIKCPNCQAAYTIEKCQHCGNENIKQGFVQTVGSYGGLGISCSSCEKGYTMFDCQECSNKDITVQDNLYTIQSGCFIATTVYYKSTAPELVMLRNFRDHYLAKSIIGRKFILIYEFFSPPLANFIRKREQLQTIVRIYIIKPLLGLICKMNL